ncbi:hypothetical protein COL922a_012919 [Colletotrichum nupharicola]|nr:hypothetical protein COL922a_012919 [Colletotrichum nupharicola]
MFFWLLITLAKSPTDTIVGGSSIPQVRRNFFDQASVDEVEAFEISTKSTMDKNYENYENNVIIVQEALITGTDLMNYPEVREVESALKQKRRL